MTAEKDSREEVRFHRCYSKNYLQVYASIKVNTSSAHHAFGARIRFNKKKKIGAGRIGRTGIVSFSDS